MTQQNPVPYATVATAPQYAIDDSHLRVLGILYFVWGGLALLAGLFCIVYIALGVMMLKNPGMMAPPPGSPAGGQPSADFMAGFFIGFGAAILAWGVLNGTLSILTGSALLRRKRRKLILITAGLTCLTVPLGTVLGVFTFIVMSRPTVKEAFTQPTPA